MLTLAPLLLGCVVEPYPTNAEENYSRARADLAGALAEQYPVERPITLPEAMARVVKYNLQHRQAMMEEAMSRGQVDLSNMDLLPKVLATAGYTERSKEEASVSRSVETGIRSTSPSTSDDRYRSKADLSLSWNVLDFGISYFTARQTANQSLIMAERRRKALNNLLQDTRHAFWRVISLERAETELADVVKQVYRALDRARAIEEQRLRNPLEALRQQRELIGALRQAEELRSELTVARIELGNLMNLPPGQRYRLVAPEDGGKGLNSLDGLPEATDDLVTLAVTLRPELREEAYQARIVADEATKSLLKLIPGADIVASRKYDSNSFTLHHAWNELAFNLGWNLMRLVTAPTVARQGQALEELAKIRRQALTMAVAGQVQVAVRQYERVREQYELARSLASVNDRISQHVENSRRVEATSEIERVNAATQAIMARLHRDRTLAEAQNALTRLYVSAGIDVMPEGVEGETLSELSQSFASAMARFDDGAALLALATATRAAAAPSAPTEPEVASISPAEAASPLASQPPATPQAQTVAQEAPAAQAVGHEVPAQAPRTFWDRYAAGEVSLADAPPGPSVSPASASPASASPHDASARTLLPSAAGAEERSREASESDAAGEIAAATPVSAQSPPPARLDAAPRVPPSESVAPAASGPRVAPRAASPRATSQNQRGWLVAAGVFPQASDAAEMKRRLAKSRLKAFTVIRDSHHKARHRVFVGPYRSKQEAEAAVAAVKRSGEPAPLVIREFLRGQT